MINKCEIPKDCEVMIIEVNIDKLYPAEAGGRRRSAAAEDGGR